MPVAISPGVYSRIYQLESYVQEVPSSTAFVALFSDKGVDNKLKFIASEEQLLKEFGKPNIVKYTKDFGQGLYIADQIALHSPSMYVIRCLPDDATYANLAIWLLRRPNIIHQNGGIDVRFEYQTDISGIPSINNNDEIADKIDPINYDKLYPLYIADENGDLHQLTVDDTGNLAVGPVVTGVDETPVLLNFSGNAYRLSWNTGTSAFVMTDLGAIQPGDNIPNFFLKSPNGTIYMIIALDASTPGTQDVTTTYQASAWDTVKFLFMMGPEWRGEHGNNYKFKFEPSSNMKNVYDLSFYEKTDDGDWAIKGTYAVSFDPNMIDTVGESNFIKHVVDTYADDIRVIIDEEDVDVVKEEILGSFNVVEYDGTRKIPGIIDVVDIIDMPDQASVSGHYFITDRAGSTLFGYDAYVMNYDSTTDTWTTVFGPYDIGKIVYSQTKNKYYLHVGGGVLYDFNPYEMFLLVPPPTDRLFVMGSDGSLFTNTGIDRTVATNLLVQAYKGLLDPQIKNRDWLWIDLVYDCGYPKDVKDAIVTLSAEIRMDCVSIVDNGDNLSAEKAVERRIKENRWNTMFAAIYEPYIKVNDKFTGKQLWMSPIFEVCKLIALNDRINEVWYAVAGYTRGAIQDLKDLRYAPLLGERDQFYLNQINPIARFKDGDVIWGQLTSQRQPGPLQDLNIVRCVLYIDRALRHYYKYNLFDMNDYITWSTLEDQTISFLTDVKNRRGLYSFDVSTYADEYMIKRKMCQVNVILFPTRVLEKIMLNIGVK